MIDQIVQKHYKQIRNVLNLFSDSGEIASDSVFNCTFDRIWQQVEYFWLLIQCLLHYRVSPSATLSKFTVYVLFGRYGRLA